MSEEYYPHGAVDYQDPSTAVQLSGHVRTPSHASLASIENNGLTTGTIPHQDVYGSPHASVDYNLDPAVVGDFPGASGVANPYMGVASPPSQSALLYDDVPADTLGLQGVFDPSLQSFNEMGADTMLP